jgi:hypothetical protein
MKLFAVIGTAIAIMSSAPTAAEKPIEVMVLGTWHFANSNRDLHNMKADDVRTPQRQRELQQVADALAKFRPTKIMIERSAKTPDLVDPDFAAYTPEALKTVPSERVQIGYRIAHNLSLPRVHAIDEQPSEGEPDYFPYGKVAAYAEAHGQADVLARGRAQGEEMVKSFGEKQARMGIPALLVESNRPDSAFGSVAPYYDMLRVGDIEQQPGAELNAMWYMRNAKIFAKLMTVAEPGDRILVIYGSGHSYWLRHFARETPGFTNVDPVPYLLGKR